MWTVQTKNINGDTVSATAQIEGFSWNATIKTDESSLKQFVEEAKKQYQEYQNEVSKDNSLRSNIETLLNTK